MENTIYKKINGKDIYRCDVTGMNYLRFREKETTAGLICISKLNLYAVITKYKKDWREYD